MDTSSHLYGLAPNLTAVYQYTGNGTTNSWTKIGGPAGTITAGSFGLVATDPATGNLFHYLGTPGNWAQIGGPGFTFVMDGNSHLYGLARDLSAVYQYTGNGSTNSWTKIGGPARLGLRRVVRPGGHKSGHRQPLPLPGHPERMGLDRRAGQHVRCGNHAVRPVPRPLDGIAVCREREQLVLDEDRGCGGLHHRVIDR